jgi:hypothetical protein
VGIGFLLTIQIWTFVLMFAIGEQRSLHGWAIFIFLGMLIWLAYESGRYDERQKLKDRLDESLTQHPEVSVRFPEFVRQISGTDRPPVKAALPANLPTRRSRLCGNRYSRSRRVCKSSSQTGSTAESA